MAEAAPDAAGAATPKQHSWLWNKDLAAIPPERRTWGTYNYTALWVAMSVNIPTYMLASGMIAGGMNWKQAIFTVFLGNVIVLIPMLLNAHAGARYGKMCIRDSRDGEFGIARRSGFDAPCFGAWRRGFCAEAFEWS